MMNPLAGQEVRSVPVLLGCVLLILFWAPVAAAADPDFPSLSAEEELEVEVVKKGLGKEVSIRKGTKEWFMLVEVTPDNTVVIRQEKDNENYVVDESETHDRPLTKAEVDTVIDDFINSVKTQVKRK
ncbi:MAG: hypothetical protein ACREJU_04450 [Nitrospiraceae bacterium]